MRRVHLNRGWRTLTSFYLHRRRVAELGERAIARIFSTATSRALAQWTAAAARLHLSARLGICLLALGGLQLRHGWRGWRLALLAHRRQVAAFNDWVDRLSAHSSCVSRRHELRDLSARRLVEGQYARAFSSWYGHVAERLEYVAFVGDALGRLLNRRSVAAFRSWLSFTKMVTNARSLIARVAQGRRYAALLAWKELTAAQTYAIDVIDATLRKLLSQQLNRGFRSWAEHRVMRTRHSCHTISMHHLSGFRFCRISPCGRCCTYAHMPLWPSLALICICSDVQRADMHMPLANPCVDVALKRPHVGRRLCSRLLYSRRLHSQERRCEQLTLVRGVVGRLTHRHLTRGLVRWQTTSMARRQLQRSAAEAVSTHSRRYAKLGILAWRSSVVLVHRHRAALRQWALTVQGDAFEQAAVFTLAEQAARRLRNVSLCGGSLTRASHLPLPPTTPCLQKHALYSRGRTFTFIWPAMHHHAYASRHLSTSSSLPNTSVWPSRPPCLLSALRPQSPPPLPGIFPSPASPRRRASRWPLKSTTERSPPIHLTRSTPLTLL